MKARIHLFEHDLLKSSMIKNTSQDGEPLYVNFDDSNENKELQPCDFLVVTTPDKYEVGDICLVYDQDDDEYYVDKVQRIIKMSDLDSKLRDVFIGIAGNVVPLDDVEKVIASSFDDGLVPEMEGDFIAYCIFKNNTGEPVTSVNVESDYGRAEVYPGNVVNITEWVDEVIEEVIEPEESTSIQVGNIIVDVKSYGVSMVLTDPSKYNETMINLDQLSEIVKHILTKINYNPTNTY